METFALMGVELVEGRDLLVQDGYVYMRTTLGLQRVDVLRSAISYVLADDKIGLDRLRSRFDAKMADATVLVAHWGATRRQDVATAGRLLVDAGADMTGLVLTRVKSGRFAAAA